MRRSRFTETQIVSIRCREIVRSIAAMKRIPIVLILH